MSTPKDLVQTESKRICPGAFANLSRTSFTESSNAPALRRWKATWEALSAELTGTGSRRTWEELDPVQRAIVAAQVKRARALLPSPGDGEIDLDWPHLIVPIGSQELRVSFQFTHKDPDGLLKMYRLKTGRIRDQAEFISAPEEIATVVLDERFPDSMEAYEIRTADGEVIRLEMPPENARETLAALETDYREMADSKPNRIVEGLHCSTCRVPDLCDAFPRISPSADTVKPLQTPRLPSHYRIMISKSRLAEMAFCERRAAWAAWFAIPPDLDHQSGDRSPDLAVGIRFHRGMAKALLTKDPGSHFNDDQEMEALYRQHLSLPCTAGLVIGRTEFPLGFTARFNADADMDRTSLSVVVYGLADAAGREPDGTPAVIDHKTGRSHGAQPHEEELYALGALLRLNAPKVATHIHRLSAGREKPICDRKTWHRRNIEELAEPLVKLAGAAARWDPLDATSPTYSEGEWCSACPFEKRCISYR